MLGTGGDAGLDPGFAVDVLMFDGMAGVDTETAATMAGSVDGSKPAPSPVRSTRAGRSVPPPSADHALRSSAKVTSATDVMTEPYGVRQRLAPTPQRMIVSCQRAALCDHIRLAFPPRDPARSHPGVRLGTQKERPLRGVIPGLHPQDLRAAVG
jgi:hypothetical protein